MDLVAPIAAAVFWLSLGIVGYVYIGYPLTLYLLPRRRTQDLTTPTLPHVSVIIPAYNEARHIVATVTNKLEQDYPAPLLDVIVVSDGSTDGTDELVSGLVNTRLRLLRQERQGKTLALNRAIAAATGEIVVFSDANSRYAASTVRELVDAFRDPAVGYVTGDLVYQDPGETAVGGGSGLYLRYENWLRRLETRVGSIVGVNGGVDAVRACLYTAMEAHHLPDLILPLRVVAQGHRVVYRDSAVAYEHALGKQADEFKMRMRVSLRALRALAEMRELLHPRAGLFAFQLLVHKLLRYLLFVPLLLALLCSGLLLDRPFYAAAFGAQLVFYGLALIGWAAGGRIRFKPVFVPFYFCLINAAAGAALVRYLRGDQQVIWTPRKGT